MSCFFQINFSLAIFSFNATRWTTEQFFTSGVTTCSEVSLSSPTLSYTVVLEKLILKASGQTFTSSDILFCFLMPNQDVRLFHPCKNAEGTVEFCVAMRLKAPVKHTSVPVFFLI